MTNQRVLTVPGGINFRELGGYSTKDGRKSSGIRSFVLVDLTN